MLPTPTHPSPFLPLSLLLGLQLLLIPVTLASKILVYTATAGYRHDSIPTAIQTITTLGSTPPPAHLLDPATQTKGWEVFATENMTLFEQPGWLNQFDALVFVSNSDEVLTPTGKTNMAAYVQAGGGYVGIHSASACLFTTPWYGRLLGAFFDYHPALQNATVQALDNKHPSTSILPARWNVTDEIYNFRSDPRLMNATVLLTPDHSTYVDNGVHNGTQGSPQPLAWYREGRLLDQPVRAAGGGVDGGDASIQGGAGRSYYTSLGHLSSTWEDPTFQAHVYGGISWVLASSTTRANNASATVGQPSSSPTSSSSGSKGSNSGGASTYTLHPALFTVVWMATATTVGMGAWLFSA